MKKWKTIAPNGKSVTIAKDSFIDITLFHRQKISDEELANRYPSIFVPCSPDIVKVVEADEVDNKSTSGVEVDEVEKDEKVTQMLTEVPKVKEVAPEDDKPIVDPGVTVETKIDVMEHTKKELIKIAKERKVKLPKIANKETIVKLLNES